MKKILFLVLLFSQTALAQTRYFGIDPVQRTLVNNIIQSERFNLAEWTIYASGLTIAVDNAIAPNGTTTAETVTVAATTDTHRMGGSSGTNRPAATAGLAYRLGLHAKQGTNRHIVFGDTGDAVFHTVTVDLQTCTSTLNVNATPTLSLVDGGWCRILIDFTRTNSGNITPDIYAAQNSSGTASSSWLGTGTETFFIWGAQSQLASTAPSTYISTIDAQVTAGLANTTAQVPLSNLALWSGQFDNASWTKALATVTANSTNSPDGATTADTFIPNAGTGVSQLAQSITLASANYRFCVFAKTSGYSFVQINNSAAANFTNYDISSGVLGTNTSNVNASITPSPNGWYRLCQVAAYAAGAINFRVGLVETASTIRNGTITANGTSGAFVWGASMQPESAPSDYVPTTTVAVTTSPLCPAGTSESINDPTRCFAVTTLPDAAWTGSAAHVRLY